ncbi:hypothetical protein [Pseudomonas profundi]|uniref:hypothetical protein n=1 Tax=Pseudomonas profundi TaxID=1981513 RepID=UPI00123C40E8|nr:hypothetical protein [Pseudomonas profundi]
MEWRRFHYICRRSHNQYRPGDNLRQCIERAESDAGGQFYGTARTTDTLPYRLLQELKQASDTRLAHSALQTYGQVDFSDALSEPLQFKRVMIYLGYVTFVLFVTSSLYQLKVAPAFLDVLQSMPVPTPPALSAYRGHWVIFSLLILALLLGVLVIGYRLRALFRYQPRLQQSLSYRLLTPPRTRRAYARVLEIAAFPVSMCSGYRAAEQSELTTHLAGVTASGMDLGREVQDLIRQTGTHLTASCEKQMRVLSVMVSVIIIAAIFSFVASVYSPIFFLGESV